MQTMWGIHNDALGAELVDEGFISVGWDAMPDLRTIGDDMSRMRQAVQARYPSAKPGAVPVWAGVLRRFAFDMAEGDVVVAPYRPDRTLNFGVVSGPYEFVSGVPRHPHRRKVTWTRTGVARSLFPQSALYEIGSAVTLFQVRKHDQVFRHYLASTDDETFATKVDKESSATTDSKNGGIDVIAHNDPLGIEPPIIKVQCKHTSGTRGRPEVQQLIGTLSQNEAGLFVTLGSFSADAIALERERQNLRLFSGADVTSLTLSHYEDLPARWQTRMPLRRVLVVDRDPEDG